MTREPSLTELANLHGSDKGTEGPSQFWSAHNYTDVYEAYLGHLRDEQLNLLEVGMGVPGDAWDAQIAHGRNAGGGASIKMWHDYFLKARVYGLDINPAPHLDNDRISTAVVDQGNPAQLLSFAQRAGVQFDVIIDDGSHRPDHQQITLSVLFPLLKPGGYYFVEDLLANGMGDPDRGRFSSPDVVSTRQVLRQFLSDGTFAQPNALSDPQALASEIEVMRFHVPKVRRQPHLSSGRSLRSIVRPTTRFVPGSETLCMLRKRIGGE
jgi:hypothetical protein